MLLDKLIWWRAIHDCGDAAAANGNETGKVASAWMQRAVLADLRALAAVKQLAKREHAKDVGEVPKAASPEPALVSAQDDSASAVSEITEHVNMPAPATKGPVASDPIKARPLARVCNSSVPTFLAKGKVLGLSSTIETPDSRPPCVTSNPIPFALL